MSQPHYTTEELMICAIAHELADDELGFVGLGTAARAYTHWPAAASPADVGYKIDMVTRGRFDVSFESAPQVDQYGNLNITEIGGGQPPKTRLVGCLAQTEHLAFIKRPMIVTDLTPRAFVPKVDFITSVGYLDGGDTRAKLGLPGPGPALCITDKAIFDFHPQSKRMRLRSLHPGQTVESVLNAMSFVPVIDEQTPLTVAPTPEEVRLIREVIDPHGTLYQLKANA